MINTFFFIIIIATQEYNCKNIFAIYFGIISILDNDTTKLLHENKYCSFFFNYMSASTDSLLNAHI